MTDAHDKTSHDKTSHDKTSHGEATNKTAEALIAIDRVSKVYKNGDNTLYALRELSLRIEEGEFVAIMGSSGSGKSTLMNVIGCLDQPTSGEYRLSGQKVAGMNRSELAIIRTRLLGFVFQSFNLLSRTTALENVELPMLYAGVGSRERQRRARTALERVGLGERVSHKPNEMSGGQQQRVAIARALVNEPRVILADEPTGNLDTKTSLEVMVILQELWRAGMTIVFVTHEPDIAAFASRVLSMRDGTVHEDKRQVPRDAKVSLAALERERAQKAAQEAPA